MIPSSNTGDGLGADEADGKEDEAADPEEDWDDAEAANDGGDVDGEEGA